MPRPSPALVVAFLALLVALSGVAYAQTRIPRDSVGNAQLRDRSVGASKLRNGAVTSTKLQDGIVTSRKVADRALRARDLAPGVLPAPRVTTTVSNSGAAVAPSAIGAVSAECPAGQRVAGGGGGFAGPPTTNDRLAESIPVGDERPQRRWRITLFNGGTQPRTPVAYAICETP